MDSNVDDDDWGVAYFDRSGVSDVTSKGVRPRDSFHPERLWGAEQTQAFLDRVLLLPPHGQRICRDPVLLSNPRTIMLYGRKGSGKNTILHSRLANNKNKFRYLDAFHTVRHWKLRAWNHTQFLEWIEETVKALGMLVNGTMQKQARPTENGYPVDSLLIVLQNAHFISHLRDPVYLNALVRLLTAVRVHTTQVRCAQTIVRVVITCSDVPTVLLPEVRQLIDQDCYVAPLLPMERRGLIIDWMRSFQSLVVSQDHFKHLTWSIELGEDAINDDPDHIVNLLTIASQATTPHEIYTFLLRINDACANPREDGGTDYNEDLIEKMLYSTELGKSIVPYNPETENSAINKYLGIDYASTSIKSAAGRGGAGSIAIVSSSSKPDPLDQKLVCKDENGNDISSQQKAKRQRTSDPAASTEPRDMHKILTEQAEERARVLRGAAKREAESKKRNRGNTDNNME